MLCLKSGQETGCEIERERERRFLSPLKLISAERVIPLRCISGSHQLNFAVCEYLKKFIPKHIWVLLKMLPFFFWRNTGEMIFSVMPKTCRSQNRNGK